MKRLSEAFVLLTAGVLACGDRAPGSEPVARSLPPAPLSGGTVLRGSVDMRTGSLTFEATGSALPASSASRAVFGDQGVLVRLYNTPVAIDSTTTPGTKTWTGNVGLRNLMSHAIGDEQAGAAPPDTMGVFVFFASNPTVTAPSPCTGCSVTVNRFDGTGTFTAAGQRYSFWAERVAAGDTTRTRRLWSFSAPSQVTAFSFDVLVSAAWPPPDEARWKVNLNGDSLPDTQEEPRWRIEQSGNGNSYSATGGILTINAGNNNAVLRFYRRDSVASAGSAYLETRMQLSSANANRPEGRIVIDDGVRFVALGIARGSVWFTNSTANFLAGTPFSINTTSGFNVYQLRKYGADSVVFYVNGTRGGAMTYASFPTTAYAGTAPLFMFGNRGITGASSGAWDYVIYESGVPLP